MSEQNKTPTLRLLSGSAALNSSSHDSGLLTELLKAELAPGLTVETACYPSIVLFEMPSQPAPRELAQGRRLLRAAGLVYLEEDAFEPGYVLVDDTAKFEAKFPHLRHLVPFFVQSKGVRVLSGAANVKRATKLHLVE